MRQFPRSANCQWACPGRGKYGTSRTQLGNPRTEEMQLRLWKLESGELRGVAGLHSEAGILRRNLA